MQTNTYTYTYTCTYTYTYMYTYTRKQHTNGQQHLHTYTYTHTHTQDISASRQHMFALNELKLRCSNILKKSQNQPIFFLIPCQHGFSLQCFTRASKLKVEPAAALLQANRHDIWPCKLRHLVPGENLGFLHLQAV